MDDIRYSELRFLRALAARQVEYFNQRDQAQANAMGLHSTLYLDMVAYLLEELCVAFDKTELQWLVGRLRGEIGASHDRPSELPQWLWEDPREGLLYMLQGNCLQRLKITYRGLRRIEELQDLLRKERVLEDFGILQSIRYFNADLEHALHRASDSPVSVIYADMDDFGSINKKFGHDAGDAVMKAYLRVVHDSLGMIGTGYRGVGDETISLVIGQGHVRAVELAEAIRQGVAELRLEHGGSALPPVGVSIGVATTPPESRAREVASIAEARHRSAKEAGKNRVVAA